VNDVLETDRAEAYSLYNAKRYNEALCKYKILAERGDSYSAHWAGWMIETGLGATKDIQESIGFYLLAAEAGSPEAQFDLARMCARIDDHLKALEWYEKSAAQGFLPAMYRLGRLYKSGKGVIRNEERAFAYFEDAANRGHLFSQRQLIQRLLCGRQGILGRIKAIFWFLKLPFKVSAIVLKEDDDERTDVRLRE
jgi:TPR repeat protein